MLLAEGAAWISGERSDVSVKGGRGGGARAGGGGRAGMVPARRRAAQPRADRERAAGERATGDRLVGGGTDWSATSVYSPEKSAPRRGTIRDTPKQGNPALAPHLVPGSH